MHLYNACLPPPVAAETKREKESFSRVVSSVRDSYRPGDPESVDNSLQWVSVIDLFLTAKSELSLEDVGALVKVCFDIFYLSQNKLNPQVRWGNMLTKLVRKYGKKLSFEVQWRPLYNTLIHTHFKRDIGPEGWKLKYRHFAAVTSLVRRCRRFFPQGSASEIWSEFRSLLENPWHNSLFEGSGLVRLFLPTNSVNQDFFSDDWIRNCLDLWDSIPHCPFWNYQWAAVVARVIKNYNFKSWESYLPILFSRFINMFEVPVADGNDSYSYSICVPYYINYLFSMENISLEKSIADSIVYLLKPRSSAQEHLERLVNLLQQYYHPSNDGQWTDSLEKFLFNLVKTFHKRLQHEQQNIDDQRKSIVYLGKSERISFVTVVLKLIDRGQYSKNEGLSETVATAISVLAYVEPSLVLPFLASRFYVALETPTATHQLEAAVMSVALAGRPILFASLSTSIKLDDLNSGMDDRRFSDLIVVSLSNALLGMDANDPPKTLATMQLVGSLFSNMVRLDDNDDLPFMTMIHFSEWLDKFLCRLFSLLLHLEPSSVLIEGQQSGSFLVEEDSYYYWMLEVLLGKLPESLYNQALKKISKFVRTNIVPGASAEVGMICFACVHLYPEESLVHLVEPILQSVLESLKETPGTGYAGGVLNLSVSTKKKQRLSPALESTICYQLQVLSIAIYGGGYAVLRYKDQLKEVIFSAFDSSSWKVNMAGGSVLQYLLGALVLYYPIYQNECYMRHPSTPALEEWFVTKDDSVNEPLIGFKWHLPRVEEIEFANELLNLHFQTALDNLLRICQTKMHCQAENEKEHLRVTLLRIDSSLRGGLSCLPDFQPSSRNGMVEEPSQTSFLIAGASGSQLGNADLREKATNIIHTACEYLLEKKLDDSILLRLIIPIMDVLGNYGSLEYYELSLQKRSPILLSATALEPPVNFIVGSHSKGKKRPGWAVSDKAYMHNLWRASQSSYYLFRTNQSFTPSPHVILLMDDLLRLSISSYENVRLLAGNSLYKMMKRWPALLSNCVLSLTNNLRNPDAPEHMVLGSCAILSSKTVLKHLMMDPKAFLSFLLGILSSSHHQSLISQDSINELFLLYNDCFAGVSRRIARAFKSDVEGPIFKDLLSKIGSMSFDSNSSHWRYNLMANRVLLLLSAGTWNDPDIFSKNFSETTGHFLKNIRSQLPQTRGIAISALNMLLKDSAYKIQAEYQSKLSGNLKESTKLITEGALSKICIEDGFFYETFENLANLHIITDSEDASSNEGNFSIQIPEVELITTFLFDFLGIWPHTPTSISSLKNVTFDSNVAHAFKRLTQECGMPVLLGLQSPLMEFANSREKSKQSVAAEVLAGVLHSDVDGLLKAWDIWLMVQLRNVILDQSVESVSTWAACIRYAVTGKGKDGTRAPLLRQQILDCLMMPLPLTATSTVVAKRYIFLSAALIELSPKEMAFSEVQHHSALLHELLGNMCHSSSLVREAIGCILSVLYSNIRLYMSYAEDNSSDGETSNVDPQLLIKRAYETAISIQTNTMSENLKFSADEKSQNGILKDNSQNDVKWMETLFHFIISTLKSGRSSCLLDAIVVLLYPVISLQETTNDNLSTLAKEAFELLKWMTLREPHLQKAVSVILSASNDSNWRIRFVTLTFVQTFMYRHTFILSTVDKENIWNMVEKLLTDTQVEIREHASTVLAGLMMGSDEDLARDFREKAYMKAKSIQKNRKQRNLRSGISITSVHGAALALAASVLSVPYDVPSWLPDYIMLLTGFISEPYPVKSTATKTVAEFRRTHADTWDIQKHIFTEDQLEALANTSSSSSYFA